MDRDLPGAIAQFLASAVQPALIEPGEAPIPVVSGQFEVRSHGKQYLIECWHGSRNLVRRATGSYSVTKGRLELSALRFGGHEYLLLLADLAAPKNRALPRQANLSHYRAVLERALHRQFPGWSIDQLTSGADLERSLSPAYVRGLIRKGDAQVAVIGAPPGSHVEGALTFGLIWCSYLDVPRLAIFVPAGSEAATCHRVRYLAKSEIQIMVYVQDESGEDPIDPREYTNLDTKLDPCGPYLVREGPEAELEHRIREAIQTLDAELVPSPVYGQVIHFAGVERGIADLLAIDRNDRLCVIEIKASEDVHLPLQALDYWMRVKWHAERAEFTAAGYFPGRTVQPIAPRLILAAPALDWHPTNETLLRYFSPDVEWQRLGLAPQHPLRVLFRAATPMHSKIG